jgi:hypothetical protein
MQLDSDCRLRESYHLITRDFVSILLFIHIIDDQIYADQVVNISDKKLQLNALLQINIPDMISTTILRPLLNLRQLLRLQ